MFEISRDSLQMHDDVRLERNKDMIDSGLIANGVIARNVHNELNKSYFL